MRKTMLVPALLPLALAACGTSDMTATAAPTPDTATAEATEAFGIFPESLRFRGVPSANPRVDGATSANALSPELQETRAAEGANLLENPATVTTAAGTSVVIDHYGYLGDGPIVPAWGDVQSADHRVEASKTEPDKNTYLVLRNQVGADPSYDYGRHFLFQGHEGGAAGYITRINLDADAAHRVTLLAATDKDGKPLPNIDGSTWDPFAERLLFTSESGAAGGVWQATVGFPSTVEDVSGALGRGGYEGIQTDRDGNVWIVEDVGGKTGTVNDRAKQPNSFLYRFVPKTVGDLHAGVLEALQVVSLQSGDPIVFHAGQADADALSADVKDLHTYGKTFATRWVPLHDTDVDGTTPFDANALAKAKQATPFKRPENGQFRPGTYFGEFYFDETGDTDNRTQAGSTYGGYGSIFKVAQTSPSAKTGTLSLVYRGDVAHSGFDNVTFLSKDLVAFVEDAGDTQHGQRNALDSAWVFDVRLDYANAKNQPVRILAQGRDAAATLDTRLAGQPGFQNDGDNEITGIHVSNGDPSPRGLLGAAIPHPFHEGWRFFYTQQHGENNTWEVLRKADCD